MQIWFSKNPIYADFDNFGKIEFLQFIHLKLVIVYNCIILIKLICENEITCKHMLL